MKINHSARQPCLCIDFQRAHMYVKMAEDILQFMKGKVSKWFNTRMQTGSFQTNHFLVHKQMLLGQAQTLERHEEKNGLIRNVM